MEISGGCLCGQTRYTLGSEPRSIGDCHCVDCRRSAGAPYVTWATFDQRALLMLSGGTRRILHAGRWRSFAECCGTHLFFEDPRDDAWIDVTTASLDRPERFPPTKAIWIEDKLPWVVLDPQLPALSQADGESS